MAERQRSLAIAKYYQNPNRCLECNSVIEVGDKKVEEVKQQRFCNKSCSAKHNNVWRPRTRSHTKPKPPKPTRESKYGVQQKGVADKRAIYFHSRIIMNGTTKRCAICGYSLFVDTCHLRPIRSFADDSLISEINKKSNLIYLCPNHHHELDGGLINIAATTNFAA